MSLFRKLGTFGKKQHPWREALERIYREEGIPLTNALDVQLESIPVVRLFGCSNSCEPMIWIGSGSPPACSRCGRHRTVLRDDMELGEISHEHRNVIVVGALFYYAKSCFKVGDVASAEVALTRLLERNPNAESAYHNRSEARLALGNSSGALSDCNQVIRMNPKAADAYLNRSAANAQMGNYIDGATDARMAIQLGINMPVAFFNLGHCLLLLGKNVDAQTNFEEFLKRAPNDERVAWVRETLNKLRARR